MSRQPKSCRVLLLTGVPGVGKSTLIRRVAEALPDQRIRGFITEEIRVGGLRKGFRLDTFNGHSTILAHTDVRSPRCLGKYGVNVDAMDHVVDLVFSSDKSVELYLIDEIGKMECFSTRFVTALKTLLDSGVKIVATIPLNARGFIQEVKERPDVELWKITRENRDEILTRIITWVRQE